jgi:pilus assembly protein CpaE
MQPLTFINMGRNEENLLEIRDALVSTNRAKVLGQCRNHDETVAEVIRLRPSAAILVLDVGNPEKDFSLIKQLVTVSPSTAIIAAASDASPTLILGSMRAGAREFLELPIQRTELDTVLNRVGELKSNEDLTEKQGRVVAVFSGKGGAGVSFFATNLAAAITVPTALVDLNLQAGDAASFLGLNPKYSIADFARNHSRLDDALITSMLTAHSTNLSVVAAPNEAHEAEDIHADHVSEVVHLLRQKFSCVVLDLPHTFDPVTVASLDLADDILVVLTLDIPGIRGAKRAIKVFDHLGYRRDKVRVVVNRWSKSIDVELHKIEGHLGEQLVGFIPNDYRKVMDSINLGNPLVEKEPSSKIALEIKRIAALVNENGNTPSPQPRKGLLRSVFGRSSSTTLELSAVGENVT